MTLPKSTMQIDQITTSDLLANQASSRREKKAITGAHGTTEDDERLRRRLQFAREDRWNGEYRTDRDNRTQDRRSNHCGLGPTRGCDRRRQMRVCTKLRDSA